MNIREISLDEALPVRHKVLWPNKPVEFCIVEGDEEGLHLGAEIDGEIVSVASIYISNNKARLRKFATYPLYQGQGIGTALIEYALGYLKTRNIGYFWCDAREAAIGFYQRLGMQTEGQRFYKSDVPYFKMELSL
ncbi:GNAT family N-acetyltransferase [Vibrio hannami]|uniref:GNAT family N-acetyltransferase n=1 Tax=Vibrio hannami TaxID=2717094 RepID=UPI00240F8EB7|nr:GNAT family N-acetyltransferase [Vibrio hannami]MDG3086401.1 GNAT family N-acetyltransferase [Vibrio hannami]